MGGLSIIWLVYGWFVGGLAGLWVVCEWCGWFAGGLAVLWVVSSFKANVEKDKNKSFIFASKREIKSARKLNVKYKNIKIKQHLQVTYLGCVLDKTLSGEPMTLKPLNKINGNLKFLYHKNKILTPTLRRMLCNAII